MSTPKDSFLEQSQWDLSRDYGSFADQRFVAGESLVVQHLEELEQSVGGDDSFQKGGLPWLAEQRLKLENARLQLLNLQVFTRSNLSVDGTDAEARQKSAELQKFSTRCGKIHANLRLFEAGISDEELNEYLTLEGMAPLEFSLRRFRKHYAPCLRSPLEEDLLVGFGESGLHGWGKLYKRVSSTLKGTMKLNGDSPEVGMAALDGYVRSPDLSVRRAAYRARSEAWQGMGEVAASILNNLAAWRLSDDALRAEASGTPRHFLEGSLHSNWISEKALSSLIEVCREKRETVRQVFAIKAQVLGEEKLHPSDVSAPCPRQAEGSGTLSYPEALATVKEAWNQVDHRLGEFVGYMNSAKAIESRVMEQKAPGAYCTYFPLSKSPMVFMTYLGSPTDVKTLAHELGHAFHAEVMKDLPDALQDYPMTVAETASNVGERLLGDFLGKSAPNPQARFNALWTETEALAAYMINIPARFEFESKLYEGSSQGKEWTPEALCELTREAWSEWYGDSLSEIDEWFWAWKLHFHLSGIRFYNYPYTFGYLFAQNVYATLMEDPGSFYERYQALLLDTGRMEVAELVEAHLSQDIESKEFWRKSFEVVAPLIDEFGSLI